MTMLENSAAIVDAIRAHLSLSTDTAVANALGVHTSAVGHWRVGRSAMSPELAIKAAALLDTDPAPLVLACLAETERKEPVRDLFRELAGRVARSGRRARKVAAILGLVTGGLVVVGTPPPAQAAPGPDAGSVYYDKWRRRLGHLALAA